MQWHPDQDRRLAYLVEQGLSARQIGDEFGVTRCSIIGRCHRLGLQLKQRRNGKRRTHQRQKLTQFILNVPKIHSGGLPNALKAPRETGHEKMELPKDQSDCAVRFLDRSWGSCAYPLWSADVSISEKMVCGDVVVNGGSYCGRHQAVVINPQFSKGNKVKALAE